MRRYPLLPITASFAAGIWAAPHVYLSAREEIFWLSFVFFLAVTVAYLRRWSYGFLLALIGFFVCGAFLAAEEHSAISPRHLDSLARNGSVDLTGDLELIGWARTGSIKRPGGEYFDLEIEEVKQAGRDLAATGVVRFYYFSNRQRIPNLAVPYGRRLSATVRGLRRPRNFMTPGGYDYEAAMRREGVLFTGLVRRPDDIRSLLGSAGQWWMSGVYTLRNRLLSFLERLFPERRDPLNRRAILKAILLGDENDLDSAVQSDFQASGTYHVLVVSGLHVGALALGLFWILTRLRVSTGWATLLVAIAIVTFALLAGARPPVLRATLMVLLYLLARLIYRERALLNSVAAAALILLMIRPSDLRDPSFQLSFLAVLVLATIAVPLVAWQISPYRHALRGLEDRQKDPHFEPRATQFRLDVRTILDYFADISSLSASAVRSVLPKLLGILLALAEAVSFTFLMQLGFAVVMALYFHRLAWSGILANIVVLPLTSFLIPIGFIALVASLVWSPLAMGIGALLSVLVSLLRFVTAATVQLTWLNPRVPTPPWFVSIGFLLLLFALAVLVERRSGLVWVASALLVGAGTVVTCAPYSTKQLPGSLEVTALDVGQGDSLLVSFPRGSTMLVDGGGAIPVPGSPPSRLDIGETVVSPFLWSRQIQRLDIVVLTHAHWDHFGGVLTVLRNFRVGELWIGRSAGNENLENLLRLAADRGVPVRLQQSGHRKEIDGVEVLVLSPPEDWMPSRVSNNDSLVLRLGYGRRHILLPGDVERQMENRMTDDGLPIASDVLKIPHHGSKTSTTPLFLEKVAPRFGIISVGPYRRFSHPNSEVLEALRHRNVRTYRTDVDGAISVFTDGYRMEFQTFRDTLRPWPAFSVL